MTVGVGLTSSTYAGNQTDMDDELRLEAEITQHAPCTSFAAWKYDTAYMPMMRATSK